MANRPWENASSSDEILDTRHHPQVTVCTGSILANWHRIDALSIHSETSAVVKSDSYGLGAEKISQALFAGGCRTFFTASVPEARKLVRALGQQEGLCIAPLNGLVAEDMASFEASSTLLPVLNTPEQVAIWQQKSTLHERGAFVHIDTGMNRLGVPLDDWHSLAAQITFPIRAIISHLVHADDPEHPLNNIQRERLFSLNGYSPSLANSAGCFLGQKFLGCLTRPGIALYGGQPFRVPQELSLVPCLKLDAPILQIRDLKAGDTIGYSAIYRCQQDCRIALIGIGYNDGIPRNINQNAHVFCGWFEDTPLPIRGRISMDSLAVEIPASLKIPHPARITLLDERQTLDDLAKACDTIPHEILTRLGGRLHRVYQDRRC